jgi:hypothetical protein
MDALSAYLNDHLAGARAALSFIRRTARHEEDTPLGHSLGRLAESIDADRGALGQIMELLQVRGRRIRQGVAWLGEKVLRVAIGGRRGSEADLARLEALELLALAVEAKRALWQSLRQLAAAHPNLRGVDLDELVRRADEQRQELESWRLAAVVDALSPRPQAQVEPLTTQS